MPPKTQINNYQVSVGLPG